MPPFQFWFSGAAFAAFIAVLGACVALAGTCYGWYRAALTERKTHDEKLQAKTDAEMQKRRTVLRQLQQEYIQGNDNITPAQNAGTELPPFDWLNKRLEELGYEWRMSYGDKR